MVLGWRRRVPDPCALFWYLHNFGAHIRVYDTGRYSSKNCKSSNESPAWRGNETENRLSENIIMDKVEDLEPPLAHVIPELTSNLLLPLAIFVWMLAIDWRMGLSILIAPALAMIPMFFLMKIITASMQPTWRQITMSTTLLSSM